MKNTIIKKRFAESFFILGIIGFLLLIPVISAIGVSSEYNSENPANVAPGETKTINLMRLLTGTEEAVKVKVELIDGAGVASYAGESEVSITLSKFADIPVKITIPKDTSEGTKYDITFTFTDLTPSKEEGMIGFGKGSTVTMPVYVKKSENIEKPATGNTIWIVLIVALAIIIAIVAYLLMGRKNTSSGKSK